MVSPARAGMDLLESLICRFLFRFPRTRGDGPRDPEVRYERPEFPPHARDGPHYAAVRLHGAELPPHARGWTYFNGQKHLT